MTQPIVTLEIVDGPDIGTRFRLSGGAAVIGRSADVDIPLTKVKSLSRRHSQVEISPEGVQVRDLGSQNGTFVNGRRIEAAPLADGSVLRVGPVEFAVHIETPGAAVPAPAEEAEVTAPEAAEAGVPARSSSSSRRRRRSGEDDDMAALYGDGAAPAAGRGFLWWAILMVVVIVAGLYGVETLTQTTRRKLPTQYIIRAREPFVVILPRSTCADFDELNVKTETGDDILAWRPFAAESLIGGEFTSHVVILEGRGQGTAQVSVLKAGQPVHSFVVHVRGMRPRDWDREAIAPEEAHRMAMQRREAALALLPDQAYEAMRAYEEAEELFEIGLDMELSQEARSEARRIRRDLKRTVSKLYEDARDLLRGSQSARSDPVEAYEKLAEIKRLIPDESSVDWQLANNVQQIARELLELQSRRLGR